MISFQTEKGRHLNIAPKTNSLISQQSFRFIFQAKMETSVLFFNFSLSDGKGPRSNGPLSTTMIYLSQNTSEHWPSTNKNIINIKKCQHKVWSHILELLNIERLVDRSALEAKAVFAVWDFVYFLTFQDWGKQIHYCQQGAIKCFSILPKLNQPN